MRRADRCPRLGRPREPRPDVRGDVGELAVGHGVPDALVDALDERIYEGVGHSVSDRELADVAAYIRAQFATAA